MNHVAAHSQDESSCSCGWKSTSGDPGYSRAEWREHLGQAFFAQLAREMEQPHHGNRDITRALLLRAEEAGLYDPKAPK